MLPATACELTEFAALCREVVGPHRRAGAGRASIDHPAREWLARVARADTLAVRGVGIGHRAGAIRDDVNGIELTTIHRAKGRQSRAAFQTAAIALERQLVGPETTSPNMTPAELLQVIEPLTDGERTAVIRAVGAADSAARLTRLSPGARAGLVSALRNLLP